MSFVNSTRCTEDGCTQGGGNGTLFRPAKTPTLRFDNNVAASCVVGMNWDGAQHGLKANNPKNPGDRKIELSHYDPRVNSQPGGQPVVPTFNGLVGYKNSRSGVYFRGEQAIFKNAIFADNGVSWFCAYNQVLKDSLVVGVSANYDADDTNFDADPAVRSNIKKQGPHQGVRVYDGPWVLDDVHFADFSSLAVPLYLNGAAERFNPPPFENVF